jgi:ribosomal protein S18 acetylase RimI-like enzyme
VAGRSAEQVRSPGSGMSLVYFKRYRMEFDLEPPLFPQPRLPSGYALVPWDESLLETHAATKYRCFRHEIDAHVFPCLNDYEGCVRLMRDIAGREGFVAAATWLLQYARDDGSDVEFCGTIQGVRNSHGVGAVQNVGIVPEHRGRGLGTCLIHRSLAGFRQAGLRRVTLEVTAKNNGAIRLYRRLGFRHLRIVYRVADVAYA